MEALKALPNNSFVLLAEKTSFQLSAPIVFTFQLMVTPPLAVVSVQIKVVGMPSLVTTTSSQSVGMSSKKTKLGTSTAAVLLGGRIHRWHLKND